MPPLSSGHLEQDADVIVVGAGPGGSTAAAHLARAGVRVLLLEKTTFPREKVCGDGLTPRAVKSLLSLGIDTADWPQNRGLRIFGGKHQLELDWPDLASYPSYGLVRPRLDFDEVLARAAQKSGAILREATTVSGPLRDERTGRIVGVTIKGGDSLRAPIVIAADGVSARTALGAGIEKRDDRPLGVAVRGYLDSPVRTNDPYLESHLELWDGPPGEGRLLPGYGWVFGVGDGTVNVGLGILNTSDAFGNVDYKDLLRRWLNNVPDLAGVELSGPVRGGALPMGFNRQPHYRDGLLLIGDAAGAVNPFNGEGIAYAMETAETAADIVIQALGQAGRTGTGAGADGLPRSAFGPVRRLLHSGTLVRRPDRSPRGHAGGDEVRAAAPHADALHPKVAGEPDGPARGRRVRPVDQWAEQSGARRMTPARVGSTCFGRVN